MNTFYDILFIIQSIATSIMMIYIINACKKYIKEEKWRKKLKKNGLSVKSAKEVDTIYLWREMEYIAQNVTEVGRKNEKKAD